MKIIKYQLATEINHSTEEEPRIELSLSAVTLGWSEANEDIARREAYKGAYTIEDDGTPEPTPEGDVWSELDAAYAEGYREGVNAI